MYCFCHMNWIYFKPISLGFSGMEFKNANGFLLIFWLLVNHKCAEPDSVLIKVDQIKNKSYPYVSLESRNKLSPCHLHLKRSCTFGCAQCTIKLRNLMHWKWQTKTLNAKRGTFFGAKIWLCATHFLKANRRIDCFYHLDCIQKGRLGL